MSNRITTLSLPLRSRSFLLSTIISCAYLLTSIPVACAGGGGMTLQGVNISGAEWANKRQPGKFDKDYIFPTTAELDYFASKGMKVIRIPFSWERMQPELNGPFDSVYLARLDQVVSGVSSRNMVPIVDVHNFGQYGRKVVGVSRGLPNSVFANFWTQMANHYKGNSKVIFGIMTEPVGRGMTATTWLASAQTAINAIRATGATQRILVPGAYWGSGNEFVEKNASELIKISDPLNNFSYDIHQYLDHDGSGTHKDCLGPADSVATLSGLTAWLKANNRTAFLSEIGVTAEPAPCASLAAILQYLHANSAQWDGYTYWAAGPWWQDYIFGVEPKNGQDTPQMKTLIQNL